MAFGRASSVPPPAAEQACELERNAEERADVQRGPCDGDEEEGGPEGHQSHFSQTKDRGADDDRGEQEVAHRPERFRPEASMRHLHSTSFMISSSSACSPTMNA